MEAERKDEPARDEAEEDEDLAGTGVEQLELGKVYPEEVEDLRADDGTDGPVSGAENSDKEIDDDKQRVWEDEEGRLALVVSASERRRRGGVVRFTSSPGLPNLS